MTLHILCNDNKSRLTQLYSTGLGFLRIVMLFLTMHYYVVKLRALNTDEKNYIPDVKLNISKLCKNLKERNINISDIHLLNIGKMPNLQ